MVVVAVAHRIARHEDIRPFRGLTNDPVAALFTR